LIKSLPESPERNQQELTMQTALGPALSSTKGYAAPEVLEAYTRARALCQQAGETPQLFQVLWGMWLFYLGQAEYEIAKELAEQCLSLARRLNDPGLLLEAEGTLGVSLFYLAELAAARAHQEKVIALYDPKQHHALAFQFGSLDIGTAMFAYAGLTLWVLGYADQALKMGDEALSLAQELSHPFSLARGLMWDTQLRQFRREAQAVREQAEAAITVATEQGFPLMLAQAPIMRGWAMAMHGQGEEGIKQIRQGLDAWKATGAGMSMTYFLALLAEAHGIVGRPEEGLTPLAEALTLVDKTGEHFWEAELYRLKGELLLARSAKNHTEAETCFQKALDVARRQEAKSLELRAAMSLSRLWQQQGKKREARELLAEVYGWFTEGFDTVDLKEAKELLKEIS
jgi:predicted ATPase